MNWLKEGVQPKGLQTTWFGYQRECDPKRGVISLLEEDLSIIWFELH